MTVRHPGLTVSAPLTQAGRDRTGIRTLGGAQAQPVGCARGALGPRLRKCRHRSGNDGQHGEAAGAYALVEGPGKNAGNRRGFRRIGAQSVEELR